MISSSSSDLSHPVSRLDRVRRIRSVSRVLAYACVGLSIVLTAGLAAYWIVSVDETILLDARLPGIAIRPIGWPVRLASMAISALSLACLIWGLLRARRCFEEFANSRFFTAENVDRLRDLAIAVFASTLLKPFAGAALSILLSWQTYATGKALVINLGSDSLLALLFAGLVAVIAWVMAEAHAIAAENAQFV
ncbi:DUF2975 domain-containing protein [Bradyrhizobium sp. KBS0727]|jgi:hypothetical protein|uniref:DUF2975 domain-containing protein n=1 Tax=unclassified Bradyrhizobium TaxID=2631580 RepID=UPI00110D3244|nr:MULTISPECIES: DUF2975 domain-containing protein [unclassified Bradyrhizobium]QDW41184.1 DUF2975 domain-containing protein [Bradyrhizobium sp. KBS0725]QDW47790.1 DUF2975 domain-containing protein [Bradyrhizobium sp. KBS0727]